MSLTQSQLQLKLTKCPKFLSLLRKIYSHPASVIVITGDWKTGKTDFALWIAELLMFLGYVSKVASNIEVYKDQQCTEKTDEPVKLVESLSLLKLWSQESGRKLFIYDEAIESSPSRGAMTSLNVGWLRFIPQLSKTHTHLLVLTQETFLIDSIFKNPTFSWGLWRKLSKKIAVFNSRKLSIEEYKLKEIPPTNIIFDPDKIATFTLEDATKGFGMLPRTLQVAMMYSNNRKMMDIEQALGIGREQIKRELIKVCRILVTVSHSGSEGKEIQKLCDEKDQTDDV